MRSAPKFTRQTRLAQVDEGGDFAFEGEITGYSSTTASVASDDYALLNRLSITVKVRFTNVLDEAMSFNKSFTAYADYDSTKLLTEVAGELVPEIVDQLVTIFSRLRPQLVTAMATFREYIASLGSGRSTVPEAETDREIRELRSLRRPRAE